jgi:hypothetical protein
MPDRPTAGLEEPPELPPGTDFEIAAAAGGAEGGVCWAPTPSGGAKARIVPGDELTVETRGHGADGRLVHPILMARLRPLLPQRDGRTHPRLRGRQHPDHEWPLLPAATSY